MSDTSSQWRFTGIVSSITIMEYLGTSSVSRFMVTLPEALSISTIVTPSNRHGEIMSAELKSPGSTRARIYS